VRRLIIILITILFIFVPSCRHAQNTSRFASEDSVRILSEIATHRVKVDAFFRNNPESPFANDTSAHYHGINWYPPNLDFYFQSKLYRYANPETVSVFGTKGEERHECKYGYFVIEYAGKEYRLNTYKFTPSDESYASNPNYLGVWFTDATTGKETYPVGRYVEVENEQLDPGHMYEIDFNKAYNPYCAYSSIYSCAIPRKEDHFDFPILAGEKRYHE
jgi:hypothetical protein